MGEPTPNSVGGDIGAETRQRTGLRTVKAALTIQIIHPSTFYIVNLTVNIS